MNPTPPGWPRISTAIFYDDARAAIEWLCRAFGFEVRLKVEGENGRIEHSELVFGEGLIMVGDAGKIDPHCSEASRRSPKSLNGANTQRLCIYVDDVNAHCLRARGTGARILMEPTTTDYGEAYWSDRVYEAEDPEAHRWYFMQRLRGPTK